MNAALVAHHIQTRRFRRTFDEEEIGMSSPFVVPDGWTINDWIAGTERADDEGIPAGSFIKGGFLDITQPDPNANSFCLRWTNQFNEACFAPDLQSGPEDRLMGENLVRFGTKEVLCLLVLDLTAANPKELSLTIYKDKPSWYNSFPSVGSGTVTATANPEPPFATDADAAGKR